MFAVQFNRILWKEYRFQRTLWLSCLVIGLLFEVVLASTTSDLSRRAGNLLQLSQIFAIMYAVGCGAVLFASEREERTSDWLLCLSASPGPTLSAKLLFAVASTVALQLVLSCFAMILSAGLFPNVNDYGEQLDWRWPLGLVVLIWSSLGSLFSRRVLNSIGAMGFWWAVTFLFPLLLTRWIWLSFYGIRFDAWHPWNRVMILFAVSILIAAEIWLGWRWCQGLYFDGSYLEALNSRSNLWWNNLTSRVVSATRIPSRVEYEQPWRRTWQRLMWEERHRESMHWLLLAAGCAMVAVTTIAHPRDNFESSVFGLTWLLILMIPIAMGVLGFSSDTNLQQPRFLCHRGLSPISVWLVKQVLWMTRAFWVTSVVFLFACYFERPDWISGIRPRMSFQAYFGEFIHNPAVAIWYILLAFGCGQLAAMLFQRVVLASVIGVLMASCIANGWLQLNVHLGVPLWWSQGIPVMAMLAISLWQMKATMLEDQSWSHRGKLLAAIIGTPVIMVIALAGYRVAEVATLPRMYPEHASSWKASLIAHQSPASYSSDEAFVSSQIDHFRRQPAKLDSATADEIVELMKRDVKSLDVPFMSQAASDVWTLTKVVIKRADDYTREGQNDKALECYLASLKLARTAATHGRLSGMWKRESVTQCIILEIMVNWMNHPSQTPEFIRKAIKSIELELALFPPAAQAVTVSYLHERKLADVVSIDEFNAYVVEGGHLIEHGDVGIPAIFFPWERRRLKILMDGEAEILYVRTLELEIRLAANQNVIELSEMVRKGSRRPIDSANPASPLRQVSAGFSACGKNVLERQTEIRAALVRMGLLAYRQEHDRLPERLIGLMGTINEVNLVDPWSGRLFDYYPTFLLSTGDHDVAVVPVSATSVEIKNDPEMKIGPIDHRQLESEANIVDSEPRWRNIQFASDGSSRLGFHTPVQRGSTLFPIPEKLPPSFNRKTTPE